VLQAYKNIEAIVADTEHPMKSSVAGVVVLYNPEDAILDNVNSYIDEIDLLYVVDNSDIKSAALVELLRENVKIVYVDNQGNQGIAHALNVGCNKAIEDGYEWILTMDQDSMATLGMLKEMFDFFSLSNDMDRISIIAPFHANPFCSESAVRQPYSEVLTTMTSGNLLNLSSYKEIGSFNEELFIDYVDNDYCLRSKLKGYSVMQVNNAILKHNLGDLKQHKVLWKRFYSTSHSPIRRYYAFRNRIYIVKTYKNNFSKYCKFEQSRFVVDMVIVLLYEKEKFQKIKMMFLGIVDGLKNKYGKFNG